MKQFILKNKKVLAIVAVALVTGSVTMSFQDSPFSYNKFNVQQNLTNTTPDKDRSLNIKDFDKLSEELDIRIETELQKIDFDKIQKEVELSLEHIDIDKIIKQVGFSLKNINIDKIINNIQASLEIINRANKNEEVKDAIEKAIKKIKEAKLEIEDTDMKKINKELEKAKLEIEKSKTKIKEIDFDKIMGEAKTCIKKAKEELKQTKEMFIEMEKDGLINTKEGFSIEYKNKSLYINGKKQSEQITDKYRHYFKEDYFTITIDKK